jgi:hypothetical protein
MNQDVPPNPEIESRLRAMANEHPVLPAELESRVLSRLRSEGILRKPTWKPRLIAVFAAVVVFVAGWATGRTNQPKGFNYVLLLQEGPTFHQAPNADEVEHRVGEYKQWASSLRSRGVSISGLELESRSQQLGTGAAMDELGGLFMIYAKNDDEAHRIAEGCPHLRYGGGVVIRPVAKT